MAGWFWLKADDESYDTRVELRQVRARSAYDFGLLVARLANAQEFGIQAVDQDRILGSGLWVHQSGEEAVFYMLEDGLDGTDVKIVWVGNFRRIGFGKAYSIAERRIVELK